MNQNSAPRRERESRDERDATGRDGKRWSYASRASAYAVALLTLAAIAPVLARAQSTADQVVDPGYLTGLHWRNIGPFRSGNVSSVTGIPNDPTTYYIGTPEAGVWKTSDAGTVWQPVFDEMHVASVGAVSVSPSNPNIVYAGTGDPSGWSFSQGNGVYKSTDAGASWRNVGLEKTRYINALIVDPANPDIVLVGAAGAAQAGGAPSEDRGVYRSADGGATWKKVLYIDQYTGVKDMTFDVSDPRVVYAAFQRATFGTSPAELAKLTPLGTGMYKSTDEGVTWTAISGQGLPARIPSYELAVASGTHGQRVYAEAQGSGRDAGGVYRSDDGGRSWSLGTKEIGSAGGRIYADPKNPDVVYLMGTSMYRSLDGARTFTSYKGAPGGDDNRDLWINPSDPRRMIMGADQGPTISVDDGATWTPWYNLPNGQFYNVVTDFDFPYHVCGSQQDSGTACVASRSDYGRIRENDWYAVGGFESGAIAPDTLNPRWIYTQGWYHVLRRYDRTTGQVAVLYTPTAADHFGGLPPMAFSPENPHVLYMAAQYVMASSDSGRNWHHVSPDLTAVASVAAADTGSGAPRFRRYSPFIQSMSLSTKASGEIWAGTNNGLVQLTRDGGQHWSNITPAGLPRRALVDAIDASHSTNGTAYIAVRAAGDWHPYIYRTTDFGKNWTKIVSGLPDDAPVRVVREDPVTPNLLYAGTVTGAWVSFDRGDHWQSLQLNLPSTVVSDITVHGNDLAISTYGRALWVMDDVTPLRQVKTAQTADAYLYKPELTYRVRWDNDQDTPRPPEVPAGENAPEGAVIYYHLGSAASGPITLSIRDAQGNLVRKYTDVAPAAAVLPNVPTYWFPKPEGLQRSAGLHRVVWDLRYENPMTLPYGYYGNLLTYTEYTLTWHAVEGNTPSVQPPGPIAIPGVYHVELTVGGHTYSQQFTIRNDPRVTIPQSSLATQLKSELEMTAGMATSYESFYQIDRMRKQLASPQVRPIAEAQALDKQLATVADSGFGVVNRDLARHLEDADFGDVLPTKSDLEAIASSCKQLDGAVAKLRSLEAGPAHQLNGTLAQAHLPPLQPEPIPANAGCGLALSQK